MRRHIALLIACLLAFALIGAACGDDDDDDTTTGDTESAADATASDDAASDNGNESSGGGDSSGGRPHTEMSPEELEVWQNDLNAVGCWAGPVDGSKGPQTEAAIIAFQTAKGLTVDGLLGPQTESALQDAVAAGETVCTTTTPDGGTTGGDGPLATLSSANYGPKDFTIASCTNAGESDLVLAGQADNITIQVNAPDGTGTLGVDGGTEGDGITLNGTVESVTVGDDGSFTVTGTFGEPNNVGETFTLTGSCAGA